MSLDRQLKNIINWLFFGLLTCLPFVFCWLNDELFEFNKMLFVYVFAIVIGGCFLARMVINRRLIWQKTILDLPLAFFLLSQIIATIFSFHPRTSLLGYYTRLNGGLLSTLAYLVLYYAFINNIDRSKIYRLLAGLFGSGIVVSLYAIFEHFGHSLSCLIIKGNFDVTCWVQDVQTRVFASFGQPNWLAAYNVMLIGLGVPLLFVSRRRLWTWLIALSCYLNFCSLIFTKSRSGILAFFAGLLLTLLSFIFVWWRQKLFSRSHLTKLTFILLGFTIPMLIWGTAYTPSWQQLLTKISASNSVAQVSPLPLVVPPHLSHLDFKITDSGDIRQIVWQGALDIWQHYPLFGTGVETFAYSYYRFRPSDHNWTSEWDFLYNKAHNEFLGYAANSGTFGLIAYLSIFGCLFVFTFIYFCRPVKQYQQSAFDNNYPLLVGIRASLLALSVTNFFGFSTVTVQVLLFILLALASQIFIDIKKITPIKSMQPSTKTVNYKPPWLSLSIIAIIGIFLLNQVWLTWYADFNYARCKSFIGQTGNSQALAYCQLALTLRPKEALYLIDTADYYAQYALALAKTNPQDTQINDLINRSLELSNAGFKLNSVNLNFYKTRFRTLSTLGALDPQALVFAKQTLEKAIELSPTDPKLTLYYSSILKTLGQTQASQSWLEKTLTLRPLYLDAHLLAARNAQLAGDFTTAVAHYQFILDYLEPQHQLASQNLAILATAAAILR